MLKNLWEGLKGLVLSKRFLAAVISVVVALAAKVNIDLETQDIMVAISPLWVYIGGQSLSDIGKGKEEQKAKAEEKKRADTAPAA